MQTPVLNNSTPNPEMLNMIRNPTTQPPQQQSPGAPAQQPDGAAPPAEGQPPGVLQGEQPAIPQPLPGTDQLPSAELPLPTLPGMPSMETAAPRQDGNFFAFLQKLADTPRFAEGINRLLLQFTEGIATAGSAEATAQAEGTTTPALPPELDALVRQLPRNEAEAVDFLKRQTTGGSRFTGELFDLLRIAYAQTNSKAAKTDILQFVRRFSDYTSSEHIEGSMVRTLGQLTKTAPREYTAQLETLTQSLKQMLSTGDRAGTLKLLQGKILPFLKDISDRHPDIRLPNTLISIFKPLAARFENGGEDGLLQAFRQLTERSALGPALEKFSDLKKMVGESDIAKAKANQRFAEQLARTADWAMKGKGGGDPRKLFRQLISNELLNKNVYLPLEHALLPMEWNGKHVLSELWIDPDADNDTRETDEKERLIRFLLHMDIPGLGPIDLTLESRGEAVELQLACPETIVPFSEQIQREMSRILENNGLKPEGIQIQKWEKPTTLTAAFPKIAKGDSGSGVNLKI